MTNRFFNSTFAPAVGSQAKSAALKATFDAIQAGMALIQAEIDNIQGSGGITSLTGFPASFSGAAGQIPVVNAAESGLTFVSPGGLTIKSIAGTSHTLEASDAGKLLIFTNSSPITVTVPPDVLSQGDVVCIVQALDPSIGISLQDKVKISGVQWSIVDTPLVDYTGLTICHKIHCRK